ncbi:MAG: SWIM zinc finger family protein [Chloroflexota bacterium]
MSNVLTTDLVLQIAPDKNSFNNGKKLAMPAKWQATGTDGNALWGEIKGTGKNPYRTQVDITGSPAYKCTCSSRKLPCKHAIGLMLIHAQNPADIPTATAPTDVQEWMDKRRARLAKAAQPKAINREAQAKRAAKRQANIVAGLDELDLWMRDLIRSGLASVQGKPRTFYEAPAKRLVDAQAPALAERVRALAVIPSSGEGWVERMLSELARMHLIIEGFRRFDALPPEMQSDLRTVVGWAMQANELVDEPGIRDNWLVLGSITDGQDRLKTRRVWLHGTQSGKNALLLEFAFGGAGFDLNYTVGEAFDAEVVYFPGTYPLRALIRQHHGIAPYPSAVLPGYQTLKASIDAYAAALAKNPWTSQFPVACQQVIPAKDGRTWVVVDAERKSLPLDRAFRSQWELFAVSGGHPVWVFGEWSGEALLPLTVAADDRMITLQGVG